MKKQEEPICVVCGNTFSNTSRTSHANYMKRKYCSRKCSAIGTVSVRHTEEAHRKQADKLRNVSKSTEHRKNLSAAMKISEKHAPYKFKKGPENPAYGRNQTGPANYNWKGGATNSNQKFRNDPRMAEWAKKVKERDKYTCQHCGAKGFLHSHHIVPLSENRDLAFDVDNGITLCVTCHETVHGRPIGRWKMKK